MRRFVSVILAIVVVGSTSPVFAQVPSALIREGDVLEGAPGQAINSISNTAVNHAGGFAVTLNTDDDGTLRSYVWGSGTGDAGTILRVESTLAGYEQNSFESFFGIADVPGVAYSALVTDTVTAVSGLDGVWLDELPIAVERQAYPHEAGRFWSFGSRPASTSDGLPYFIGGIADTEGGSTRTRGLFYGLDASPLLLEGEMVPGLADPVTDLSFDYRFSALGTHYVVEIATDTGSSTNDNSMAIDGAVAMSNGAPVREGSPIPIASGGLPGENWDNFDFAGITETGSWMITGNTDVGGAVDEFLAIDGVIVLREGDLLDGEILTGAMEGAYLNEDGDYAFVWDVVDGTGSLEALYVGDRLLLKEGDEVDFDGDGVVDPGAVLDNFTGISTLTLGDRNGDAEVDVYFTADIEVPISLAGTGSGAFTLTEVHDGGSDRAGLDSENRPADDHLSAPDLREAYAEAGRGSDSERGLRGTEIREGFFRVTVSLGTSSVEPALHTTLTVLRLEPSVVSVGSTTTVRFAGPTDGRVTVDIFSVGGRHQRNLTDAFRPSGVHHVRWDGTDDGGRALPAGTYLVRLRNPAGVATARVTIVK